MITTRITRLVRVPDLRTLHAFVAREVSAAAAPPAVIVPTRLAGRELRATVAIRLGGARPAFDALTRDDLYVRLHAAAPGLPPLLKPPQREVLLRRAARSAAAAAPPPFSLRPGLLVAMLDFYDELRRRRKSLDDFERNVTTQLAPSVEIDRGAERLQRQTQFLAAAYDAFEHLMSESGGLDEHALRPLLLDSQFVAPYTHVVATIADRAADAAGLYPCDFDLLARMPGVARLDIVATEELLASGFLERVYDLLPGLEELRLDADSGPAPVLAFPDNDDPDRRWFISRDREEELVEFVRDLTARGARSDRAAVVFQRPLPYLYLARTAFGGTDVSYRSADALPLAAEPFAAAIDLVLSFLSEEANRASTIALLSSPHFTFGCDAAAVSILDKQMREGRYSGGWERLTTFKADGGAMAALEEARRAAFELAPVRDASTASSQLAGVLSFVERFERQPSADAAWRSRHLKAREIILSLIADLRDAHASHDDGALAVDELAASIRRWIESRTFTPGGQQAGVRLLDAASAPYADVDEMRIVGLVESEWPESAKPNIFYPAPVLANLGWTPDTCRTTAARAHFRDLLHLPAAQTSVSTFLLEDDAVVTPSAFLEETAQTTPNCKLQTPKERPFGVCRLEFGVDEWGSLREQRTPSEDPRYHGAVGACEPRTYAVSHVERYLDCPFKYFAAHVLKLPEEREDESGLTPRERGQFLHEVFEEFFRRWQQAGRQTITTENVTEAIGLFKCVVDERLDRLPEADRALERTYLVGSAAAPGLAERAFLFEIEQGGEVVERLLEYELKDTFEFAGAAGPRQVAIRAKADRIDLMADGTLRVIDYKLGRAPKASRALQLPIYGVCAEQALAGRRGRSWRLAGAGYVAFKEKDAFVPMGGRQSLAEALQDGQQRFLDAIDGIERGEFPVRPEEPFRCQWCAYAGVCRKDYVGDE